MSRRHAVSFVALLAAIACQKQEQAPVAREPDAPPAAVEEGVDQPVDEGVEEKVEVTPALVGRFIEYRKKFLQVTRDELAAFKASHENLEKNSTAANLAAINDMGKMSERLDAKDEALKKAAGLSERQVEVLDDLVSQVVTVALVARQMPDMTPMVEQLKEQAKNAPEEHRAEILAEAERMEKGVKEMLRHAEAREAFGDAAVDAVLPHLDTLAKLQSDLLEVYAGVR